MKLTYSPASPFARKVRMAAIELGLIDKIEFVPTAVAAERALPSARLAENGRRRASNQAFPHAIC